jgi:hypothetical protein
VKARSLDSALAMFRALGLGGIGANLAFGQVFHKDLEIRVDTLPTLLAPSKDPMLAIVP